MVQPVPLEGRPTRLLDDRIRTLFRHLPLALGGDEESVHQMRVAARRLRVLLPVLVRKPEGRRVQRARRRLRALIRTAAACRDLDVSVTLFERDDPGSPVASPDARILRRQLRAARGRSRRRMMDALLDLDVAALRSDLRTILARGAEEAPVVTARVREARNAAGQALGRRLAALGEAFDPEPLHDVRTVVRRLRYLAEAQAELDDGPRKAGRVLRALQDELGQVHDAWVLAKRLGESARSAEQRGQSARVTEARQRQSRFEALSRTHHRAFLALGPAETVQHAVGLPGEAEPAPLRLVR